MRGSIDTPKKWLCNLWITLISIDVVEMTTSFHRRRNSTVTLSCLPGFRVGGGYSPTNDRPSPPPVHCWLCTFSWRQHCRNLRDILSSYLIAISAPCQFCQDGEINRAVTARYISSCWQNCVIDCLSSNDAAAALILQICTCKSLKAIKYLNV